MVIGTVGDILKKKSLFSGFVQGHPGLIKLYVKHQAQSSQYYSDEELA